MAQLSREYGPRDYSVVPRAPGVAALMEYKDFDVDLFHGVPGITLPLHELKAMVSGGV